MTHIVGGSRRRVPRVWLFPLVGLVALLLAASGGVVSRAILVDLLAWWPVWGLIAISTHLTRDRRLGKIRLAGLVPIVAFLTLGVFVYGYFQAWTVMPSATNHLVGPSSGTAAVAALSARISEKVVVKGAPIGFLYEVQPLRGGGDTAAAEAVERTQPQSFSVALRPMQQPGLYSYSGWEITLAETTQWSLTIGGAINADLSSVDLAELNLIGSGRAELGVPDGPSPITVEGAFTLSIPMVPVRVIGDARVPEDWLENDDGWESPVPGDGWVISVSADGSLLIVDQ